MNFRKMTAAVLAVLIAGGGWMPMLQDSMSVQHISVHAAEQEGVTLTVSADGELTTTHVNDAVAALGCAKSEIKNVVIEGNVTSIGDNAFSWCVSIASVTFPDTVKKIGSNAFFYCTGIKELTLPEGLESIGGDAFNKCTGLTAINIPDGVTSIGKQAFTGCSALAEITIPETVTEIGAFAFNATPWLKAQQEENALVIVNGLLVDGRTASGDVTVPDGVTEICDSAFTYCTALTSVKLSDTVISIGNSAFSGCAELAEFDAAGALQRIGSNAFSKSGLTKLTIPESVVQVGEDAFAETPLLETETSEDAPTVIGHLFVKAQACTDEYEIPENVTVICDGAFRSMSEMTGVVIPNGVKTIGASAFEGCYALSSVTIPDSVSEIGERAFYTCSALAEITLPKGLTAMRRSVFDYTQITEIKLHRGVTSIESGALSGCGYLRKATIPDSVTFIAEDAFSSFVTICGVAGSEAENYAKKYGMTFIPVSETEFSAMILGDMNGDGNVDEADAVIILSDYVCTSIGKSSSFTDYQKQYADVNADGNVDAYDAYLIHAFVKAGEKDFAEFAAAAKTKTPDTANAGYSDEELADAKTPTLTLSKTEVAAEIAKKDGVPVEIRFDDAGIMWEAMGFHLYCGSSLKPVMDEDGKPAVSCEADVEMQTAYDETNGSLFITLLNPNGVSLADTPIMLGFVIPDAAPNVVYNLDLIYRSGDIFTEETGENLSHAALFTNGLKNGSITISAVELTTGDLNGDGIIDSSDASLILRHYANISIGLAGVLTDEQLSFADVNGDGIVDAFDAQLIISYYLRINAGFEETLGEYAAAFAGEFPTTADGGFTDEEIAAAEIPYTLSIPDRMINTNALASQKTYSIPVTFTGEGAWDVLSFHIAYDERLMPVLDGSGNPQYIGLADGLQLHTRMDAETHTMFFTLLNPSGKEIYGDLFSLSMTLPDDVKEGDFFEITPIYQSGDIFRTQTQEPLAHAYLFTCGRKGGVITIENPPTATTTATETTAVTTTTTTTTTTTEPAATTTSKKTTTTATTTSEKATTTATTTSKKATTTATTTSKKTTTTATTTSKKATTTATTTSKKATTTATTTSKKATTTATTTSKKATTTATTTSKKVTTTATTTSKQGTTNSMSVTTTTTMVYATTVTYTTTNPASTTLPATTTTVYVSDTTDSTTKATETTASTTLETTTSEKTTTSTVSETTDTVKTTASTATETTGSKETTVSTTTETTVSTTAETTASTETTTTRRSVAGYTYMIETREPQYYFADDENELLIEELIKRITRYAKYSDGSVSEKGEKFGDFTGMILNAASPRELYETGKHVYSLSITIPSGYGETTIEDACSIFIGVKGDANLDGVTDAKDAASILVYAAATGAGTAEPLYSETDAQLESFAYFLADVNGEEEKNSPLDATDAAAILTYAAAAGTGEKPDWDKILGKTE